MIVISILYETSAVNNSVNALKSSADYLISEKSHRGYTLLNLGVSKKKWDSVDGKIQSELWKLRDRGNITNAFDTKSKKVVFIPDASDKSDIIGADEALSDFMDYTPQECIGNEQIIITMSGKEKIVDKIICDVIFEHVKLAICRNKHYRTATYMAELDMSNKLNRLQFSQLDAYSTKDVKIEIIKNAPVGTSKLYNNVDAEAISVSKI